MATYFFATMTAAQAAAITAADTVIFATGPAVGVSAAYVAATATSPDSILVTQGALSLLRDRHHGHQRGGQPGLPGLIGPLHR